ncbi:MAG TPA: C4-type zinc ribbon domain-containing protein [Solirubrobacterales bacterium]|nr:C4-type zinc ribbon domain-containing protein [Solirubrobacterales bacterium]
MDPQLQTLIELQERDSRIAGLEAEAARLPRHLEAIQASLAEARKAVQSVNERVDATRKSLRTKEKDLEVTNTKRTKAEGKLWEVKTNKEYSAALLEIEEIKQEKAQAEEEILGLMELQERLSVEVREADARFKAREAQAHDDEAVVRKKLDALEQELAIARAERASRARELPPRLLGDYERICRARGGVAVAPVISGTICGGCRMSIRPQALQELRTATVLSNCENCGRFLYWQD